MSAQDDVRDLLKHLHDTPADTQMARPAVLLPIYNYLMDVAPHSGQYHWFCDQAEQLTLEAASFLLRLIAYSSDQVDAWKLRLEEIMAGCAHCVKGLAEAKLTSRRT
jgi:senataxin